jgi:hypothetical protein
MCIPLYIYCIITDIMELIRKRNQTDLSSENPTKRTRILDIYAVIIWQKAKCRQCFSLIFLHSVYKAYSELLLNVSWCAPRCIGATTFEFCSLHDRWHISCRRGNLLVFISYLCWTVYHSCLSSFLCKIVVYCCCLVPNLPFKWTSYV